MTMDEVVGRADDTGLSETELRDLQETAERLFATDGPGDARDRSRWQRTAELGLLALTVSEKRGGAGAGIRAAAAVLEAAGAVAAPEPLVAGAVLPTAWLCGLAPSPAVDALVEAVLAGGRAAVAWQPADGSLEGDVPVTATGEPNETRLHGRASWVAVEDADIYLVLAQREGTPLVAACPADAPGLTAVAVELADGSHWVHLDLDGVVVPADAVLAEGPGVRAALGAAVDLALVLTAAELTALSRRALDVTLEHLRTRHQFGRPLGSFQSAQHAAVDMYVQVRLSAAALAAALAEWERPDSTARERAAAASSAKARATVAVRHVTTKAVHLHGALGFTAEYVLGGLVNRGLVLGALLGGADLHRGRHHNLIEEGRPA
ncbi:MAG: hypothetical protein QOC85_1023 [Streptomyces sp.]|nr:hypothetical protein [Streptomyces sp.]